MIIRKAKEDDLESVFRIYEVARAFMKKTGNPNQWRDKHPPKEMLCDDVVRERLYVAEEDGVLYGAFALYAEGDPVYDTLGATWQNDAPYIAIHRVASSGEKRGILRAFVEYALTVSKNIKIDTHAENVVMQSALEKLGFRSCGIADIPDVGERILYQRCDEE